MWGTVCYFQLYTLLVHFINLQVYIFFLLKIIIIINFLFLFFPFFPQTQFYFDATLWIIGN